MTSMIQVGAADWKAKGFLATIAEPLTQQPRVVTDEEAAWGETRIADPDFLAFVLFVLTQGPKWAHQYPRL